MRTPYKPEKLPQPSGFPSPATEYEHYGLDLNLLINKHPAATEIVEFLAQGGEVYNINTGDLLVVDRSIIPKSGQLIIKERDHERFITRFQGEGVSKKRGEPLQVLGVITWILKSV